jgi:predicted transglutaminase-like cysteine proteinase
VPALVRCPKQGNPGFGEFLLSACRNVCAIEMIADEDKLSMRSQAYLNYPSLGQRLRCCLELLKLAIAVVCVCATTQVVAEDTHSSPHATFSVAGFNENQEFPAYTAQSQDVLASQAHYRTDKAELDAALDECSKKPTHCPAPMKAFAKMIGNLKKFSDNTLLRALIVNAWLNSSIIYDSEEARGAKRQTLLATILHKRGICDEVTQLKLYALRSSGTPADDVRYLAEVVVTNGKMEKTGHAVVAIKDGQNRTWILDNQDQQVHARKKTITLGKAIQQLNDNSGIQRAEGHVNFDGHSVVYPKQTQFYPYLSYNDERAGIYDRVSLSDTPIAGPLPAFPATAYETATILESIKNTQLQNEAIKTILPAIALHSRIVTTPQFPMKGPRATARQTSRP